MPREYCIEAKDREIKEKIKYWFFFLNTVCNVCGCEYNEHSIDSYRLRRDVVDVEYYPLGETLKNQYEERNVLLASLAKLSRISTVISQQRWFAADDKSYFEKQIGEENKKLEGVRNQKRLALLKNVRNLYTAARSTINNEPTVDEVSEIEPLIRSLPINGAMLGEIIDAQEDEMNEKADVLETEFIVGEQTCHPWFLCLLRKKMSEQEAFMFFLQNSN